MLNRDGKRRDWGEEAAWRRTRGDKGGVFVQWSSEVISSSPSPTPFQILSTATWAGQ